MNGEKVEKILYKFLEDEAEVCERGEISFMQRPRILDILEINGSTIMPSMKLKYFCEPKEHHFPINLKAGLQNLILKRSGVFKPNLQKMEYFIMQRSQNLLEMPSVESESTLIFSSRYVLHRIMIIPYRLFSNTECNDSTFKAIKFKNAIYLLMIAQNFTSEEAFYPFTFDQHCFSDSPQEQPDAEKRIDLNEQKHAIYQSKLKEFDLIYSGDIKGVLSWRQINDIKHLNSCNLVSTRLMPKKPDKISNWLKSMRVLNFWIKDYLSNVSIMYLAFRDGGYIPEPGRQIAVGELPQDQTWKPSVCTKFLHKFLAMIKKEMADVDCPYTVFEFRYDSTMGYIKQTIHKGRTEHSFLSDDFINFMQTR